MIKDGVYVVFGGGLVFLLFDGQGYVFGKGVCVDFIKMGVYREWGIRFVYDGMY